MVVVLVLFQVLREIFDVAVSIATCTSGLPVSPGWVAYSSMIVFLASGANGIDDPSHSLRGARHVNVRALFIRGRYTATLRV